MRDSDNDRRHAVALFRYGLIADLVQTPGTKGLYRRLEEKAAADYTVPGSACTRVAPETRATGSSAIAKAASRP